MYRAMLQTFHQDVFRWPDLNAGIVPWKNKVTQGRYTVYFAELWHRAMTKSNSARKIHGLV
jgi:hypothetical protein